MGKSIVGLLIKAAACISVASAYLGASLFFRESFYFGTTAAGLEVGGYTVEAVQYAIDHKGEDYQISLYGKGADKQKLYGKDFLLEYTIKDDLKAVKKEQNAWAWPLNLFKHMDLELEEQVSYDEALLEKAIEHLSYFKASNVIEPVSANVIFNGETYEIVSEIEGKKLNKEAVKKTIIDALNHNIHVVSLEDSGCYEKPRFTKDSPEIVATEKLMNQYISSDIVYVFGKQEEKVDAQLLNSWLEIDDTAKVSINEERVRAYLKELDNKYSTLGKTREFMTSDGNIATVSGGDYGWQISITKEAEALIEAIKCGESIHREPIATQVSQSYSDTDIGNSYVEISLTKQYLWYYKNGSLITESSVVTGDKSRGRITPEGTYKLDYKERNATLKGPGYSTPVSFWMPFNGDIGIHDAVWRSRFGGDIYIHNGSHGCVNVPYSTAQAIYHSIDETIPIICYY